MKYQAKLICAAITTMFLTTGIAQEMTRDDNEEIKIAAMEALLAAPADRALPLANKVLAGNNSIELKKRALFVLSQIDEPGAQATLLEFASNENRELRLEAIQMIGISDNEDSLASLGGLYERAGTDTRGAILEALMIADQKQAVYDIATKAEGQDLAHAIQMLAVMDADEELRLLAGSQGPSESLIEAYAISEDLESLEKIALESSDPALKEQAIEAIGIIGGGKANSTLVQIFRENESPEIREAALNGLMISGHDAGVLGLYQSTDDPAMKRRLLEYLVLMDSDEVWNIIDPVLNGDG